jgi:hypothetical protein
MFYTVLLNGHSLGTFGHPTARNMSLSVSVDKHGPAIFVSAVCVDGEDLYFYDWLQLEIAAADSVKFVPAEPTEVPAPRNRYKMRPAADG